jgi:hypothetical protein
VNILIFFKDNRQPEVLQDVDRIEEKSYAPGEVTFYMSTYGRRAVGDEPIIRAEIFKLEVLF